MEDQIDKLTELVMDEDKIVTVASFAKDQRISIQESRKIINEYVERFQTVLSTVYVLSGCLKENNTHGIVAVKDNQLDEASDLFEKEPSKTIFSVQKSPNVDFTTVALVDRFTDKSVRQEPLLGTIVGKNCIKREIKRKVLPPPPGPVEKGKSSFFTKTKSEDKVKEEKPKQTVQKQDEPKAKAAVGVASMFSKMSNDTKNTNKKPSKGGIANFFSKTSSNGSNSEVKKENGISRENSEKSEISEIEADTKSISREDSEKSSASEKLKLLSSEDFEDSMDVDEEPVKAKVAVKKEPKSEKKKKPKRARSKSGDRNSKRRKRIIETQDSDSDDMFGKEEDEDIIEKSDEDRIPSPICKKPLAPKNKRRKAVERTYQDEEGYIVTKTEYVYESASEDEPEITENPKEKPVLEKKNSNNSEKSVLEKKNSSNSENEVSPKKATKKSKKEPSKNQPTLMNFFKKK